MTLNSICGLVIITLGSIKFFTGKTQEEKDHGLIFILLAGLIVR